MLGNGRGASGMGAKEARLALMGEGSSRSAGATMSAPPIRAPEWVKAAWAMRAQPRLWPTRMAPGRASNA